MLCDTMHVILLTYMWTFTIIRSVRYGEPMVSQVEKSSEEHQRLYASSSEFVRARWKDEAEAVWLVSSGFYFTARKPLT
jgi:hypothetical protein